jgi:hypothetical protein
LGRGLSSGGVHRRVVFKHPVSSRAEYSNGE